MVLSCDARLLLPVVLLHFKTKGAKRSFKLAKPFYPDLRYFPFPFQYMRHVCFMIKLNLMMEGEDVSGKLGAVIFFAKRAFF